MLVTMNKWGNSEAIRIPKILAETLNIHSGDKVDLSLENDTLVIRKAELKGRDLLASLLSDYEENDSRLVQGTEDWDFVAEEIWEYGENK